jgi:hypothetical protein
MVLILQGSGDTAQTTAIHYIPIGLLLATRLISSTVPTRWNQIQKVLLRNQMFSQMGITQLIVRPDRNYSVVLGLSCLLQI